MQADAASPADFAPPLPNAQFVIGVTGHRSSHPSFPQDATELNRVLSNVLDQIGQTASAAQAPSGDAGTAEVKLVTLLADGADHLAAQQAVDRGWDLIAPLPFGSRLNAALNAHVDTLQDAEAVLAGKPASSAEVARRVQAINDLSAKARLFELADQDEAIAELLRASFDEQGGEAARETLQIATSRRAAMAGSLLVEQSDLVIAIWDGKTVDSVGGTGHTIAVALEKGVPVLWIHPTSPAEWRLYHTAESMSAELHQSSSSAPKALAEHVRATLELDPPETSGRFAGIAAISTERWRASSSTLGHVYRRVEAYYGRKGWRQRLASLRQTYETPDAIGEGSGKALLQAIASLPGQDAQLAPKVESEVMRRFAWTDGISANLADHYRSGMVLNFVLGAAAIIVGTLYLPLVDASQKWIFAGIELGFLLLIIINTAHGQRHRLHGRWFESRRAAEYLRHSPFLLAMGVARSAGRWPQGVSSWWPEWYVRQTVKGVGLPKVKVDANYLTAMLQLLRDHHVDPQRAYHKEKSKRLDTVHHRLDRLSEYSFAAAVFFVGLYLALAGLSAFDLFESTWLNKSSKWFTVAAVALPTIGGAIAAIRYFADFERFADISKVTASELDHVATRIDALLSAPKERLDFAKVAKIVHDTDDIVFSEIENWQAVFSGKRTTIPA